ncbi:MAG: DUF29 family protein [Acetobacteraceae bacterium]|nr:DUF29 family protein [Acetobacteraceae bacterium]
MAHWRGEIAALLAGARRRFTPSMRQRIDLAGLYADALYEVRAGADDAEPRLLPTACPFTPDDLLAERSAIARLMGRVSAASDHD